MIVVGGRNAPTYEFVPKRSPGEGVFPLDLLGNPGYDNLYPYVKLIPDGNLFIFATKDSILLNPTTGAVLRKYPTLVGNSRNYPAAGSAVLLPLSHENGFQIAEVLVCGGATMTWSTTAPASKSCGRMEVTSPTPQWLMEDMPVGRTMGDMILLPTGDVLIINGAKAGAQGWGIARDPAFQPCLYAADDPANRFQLLAPTTVPRVYHSTANLLSDGRILLAGSNTHQFYTYNDTLFPTELSLEAFSPPYLNIIFDSKRPTIIGWPKVMTYGSDYLVTFTVPYTKQPRERSGRNQWQDLVEAKLSSAPFATHSYAMGQRQLKLKTVPLERQKSTSRDIAVTAPPNSNVAPPQYYMFFIVNGGIPGKARWVQIRT